MWATVKDLKGFAKRSDVDVGCCMEYGFLGLRNERVCGEVSVELLQVRDPGGLGLGGDCGSGEVDQTRQMPRAA